MKASILDLRRRMPDILRALDRREPVVVTYRGKERAVLRPLPDDCNKPQDLTADPAFGMWKDREEWTNPSRAVRELRRRRRHAL